MEKYDMLYQVAKQICDAHWTYTCARNSDAGLVDEKVDKKILSAIEALKKQMKKYQKKK